MRIAASAALRSTLQRPTVNRKYIPSAAGSPSALVFHLLSALLHTNGLG
jgi:hypothetical protein